MFHARETESRNQTQSDNTKLEDFDRWTSLHMDSINFGQWERYDRHYTKTVHKRFGEGKRTI